MRTNPLYALNSAIKEFSAHVIAVAGDEVALDETAFFPGGGGQPHDLGTLKAGERSWPVLGVRKSGELIWHKLQDGGMPDEGELVWGQLDWQRRYRLMRTHTALH